MQSQYDFTVIGDICLDWFSNTWLPVSFHELEERHDGAEWIPIEETPGGSGLLFAKYAQEAGYKPFLIGKVGNDPSGALIIDWLANRGIEAGVTIAGEASTAKVFMIHDLKGLRLLIASEISANSYFSLADVLRYEAVIGNSKALFVSGHCFRQPQSQRQVAASMAISIARSFGREVIFDVVPHEFYRLCPDWSQFQTITTGVTILISGLSSVRRLLGLGNPNEEISRTLVEETADMLKVYYDKFILSFGTYGLGTQVVWNAQKRNLVWQESSITKLNRRGLGDRLAIELLSSLL